MNRETYVVELSVDEWINIPDCPRQRDTVQHAKKAGKGHLAKYSPTHAIVSAASLGGNILCKLDGHTRAYLWNSGDLERPKQKLVVCMYPVRSMAEACELYPQIDNIKAAEQSTDRIAGACRENAIDLKSVLLRHKRIATSLRLAHSYGNGSRTASEYEMVAAWREELIELDSWLLRHLHSALIGLALLAIRSQKPKGRGLSVRDFFIRYCSDAGVKTGRTRDGVQALSELMVDRRAKKAVAGGENFMIIAEKGLTCLNAYIEGRTISAGIRRTSLTTLISDP